MALKTVLALYSQGTAVDQEDGFIINEPFFGVVDGFSPPYSPTNPKILFNGLSGGEMVRRQIQSVFYSAHPLVPLDQLLLLANDKIRLTQAQYGIYNDNPGLLAGASFVFAKIEQEIIQIIQGGDCLAVWLLSSGEINSTDNQAYAHVTDNLNTIKKLMKRNQGNRRKMWDEFLPILSERRNQDCNRPTEKGYAVLNGDPTVEQYWQTIIVPTEEVEKMILFSDGLIQYEETADMNRLSGNLLQAYSMSGIKDLLDRKRLQEIARSQDSYVSHEEVTAVVIQLR